MLKSYKESLSVCSLFTTKINYKEKYHNFFDKQLKRKMLTKLITRTSLINYENIVLLNNIPDIKTKQRNWKKRLKINIRAIRNLSKN